MVKQQNFLLLFKKFIASSKSGNRLKKDGTRIKKQSVDNYSYTERLLQEFVIMKTFDLVIYQIKGNSLRDHIKVKKYYMSFYKQFIIFLYKEKNCRDNYVGQTIRNIRTFYVWLNNEKCIVTGPYYKNFYIYKEDIPITTLSVKQLQFLAFDKDFETKLSAFLKRTKDIFVFGCIVGLRFSDLISIRNMNIENLDGNYYLKVRSKKTGIDTLVKLPAYALEILNKFSQKKKSLSILPQGYFLLPKKTFLFPHISLNSFNTNIKKMAELAGWTEPILRPKSKSGLATEKKRQMLPDFVIQ